MTDDDAPVSREEFEALLDRVDELEQQLESRARTEMNGLDHRDKAVLYGLETGGHYSPRSLVKKYLRLTDITNDKTAQNRAKKLANRDELFHKDGRRLVFGGVVDDE